MIMDRLRAKQLVECPFLRGCSKSSSFQRINPHYYGGPFRYDYTTELESGSGPIIGIHSLKRILIWNMCTAGGHILVL
jgi:hypothetical protein